MKQIILIFCVIAFCNVNADTDVNNSEEEAVQFIKQLEKDYLGTLQSKTVAKNKKYKIFVKALEKHFAIKSIGAFVLGRHRRLFSAEDRERFYKTFTNMLTVIYVDKFQHFGDVKLFDFSARKEDNTRVEEYTVLCKVKTNNQSDVQLKWTVIRGQNGFKILNIIVDGISINVLQRDEFAQQLSHCGDNITLFLRDIERKYGELNA